jgi:hypothetical protein
VRSKAIRQVGKVKGPAAAAPAPAVSSASVREAASAAADAAAALGDWLLSPAPDAWASDFTLRARGLTQNFVVPSLPTQTRAGAKPAEMQTEPAEMPFAQPAESSVASNDMPYAAPKASEMPYAPPPASS